MQNQRAKTIDRVLHPDQATFRRERSEKARRALRETDRRRAKKPERKAYKVAQVRAWRERNPGRYKAHLAVHRALRNGTLKKGKCERCPSTKVHGHHDDYSRPLEVRWMCGRHHAEHHRKMGDTSR